MSISYLSLTCNQCGIEKTLYFTDTSPSDRQVAEADFIVIHSGHECIVGVVAALKHTYDPETEKVIRKPKTKTKARKN